VSKTVAVLATGLHIRNVSCGQLHRSLLLNTPAVLTGLGGPKVCSVHVVRNMANLKSRLSVAEVSRKLLRK
jgi:hypothetical protein